MSKVYVFKKTQHIAGSMNEVWEFFSNPYNLKNITPSDLGFKIIGIDHGDRMYPGQIIEYIVKPIFSIPVYWLTEITHVEKNRFFIDEQRFGPYSLWHHQHHFKETEGGVEMTDIVHYKIPFWFVGDIANKLFVQKKINEIFDFRSKKTDEHFGQWKNQKN